MLQQQHGSDGKLLRDALQQVFLTHMYSQRVQLQHPTFTSGSSARGQADASLQEALTQSTNTVSLCTHPACLLLVFGSLLGVGHGSLYKAHRLVHVAFDPVNHPTLAGHTTQSE